MTLWRPTGPNELVLVEESGWRAWRPRLPDQPIVYPVLNENYATQVARDWNVKHSGAGYVARFAVSRECLDRYEVQQRLRHHRCGVKGSRTGTCRGTCSIGLKPPPREARR